MTETGLSPPQAAANLWFNFNRSGSALCRTVFYAIMSTSYKGCHSRATRVGRALEGERGGGELMRTSEAAAN